MTKQACTARAFAMAKNCRNQGGKCPCETECKAESELARIERELKIQLGAVQYKLEWLRRKPCTVRESWIRPKPPAGEYQLSAVNDGEGWSLHWYSETEEIDYIEVSGDAAWPFVEGTAWPEDWERLGVLVV